jgi:hypothetical protein
MYPLFLSNFNETNSLDRFSIKNIKFYQNPSSGSRVVPCGQTDGENDMTKLTVVVRKFANAPKNQSVNAVQ